MFVFYLPDPCVPRDRYSSVRGKGNVALSTLYLLMVGDVGLGLVDGNDRFLLPLKVGRGGSESIFHIHTGDTPHLAPLAKESDVIDPSRISALRGREE